MLIELNLLKLQSKLQLKTEFGKYLVGDRIRNKYVALTPEELVRQLVVIHLIEERHYPKSRIQVEKLLKVNQMDKRFDILVYDQDTQPFLVIECKSYKIPIQQNQIDQVSNYNLELNAPYTMITNGHHGMCFKIDKGTNRYDFLVDLPDYQQ